MTWTEPVMGWLWLGCTDDSGYGFSEKVRIVKRDDWVSGRPAAYPYRVIVPGFLSFQAQNLDEAKRLAQAAYVGQHREDVIEQ